jgi:N-carbamoyl-L-amino-acid hydrolase
MDKLHGAIESQLGLAGQLFEEIGSATADKIGITRDAFGPREEYAARAIERAARDLRAEVTRDPGGNVYVTLPGRTRDSGVLIGSHLDSVPNGGNYDGLAGVVAGMTVIAALAKLGIQPETDITVMGIRSEESAWFGTAYLGSKLALGKLPDADLDNLKRFDTGLTLREHIRSVGGDPDNVGSERRYIDLGKYSRYLELHIEQGPILVAGGNPVAIPTAIRGNLRYPFSRCFGEYTHSAGVPRAYRKDAALAVVELVSKLDARWQQLESEGHRDTVFTVGKLFTDRDRHAMTKVPGEIGFSLNFGDTDAKTMQGIDALIQAECRALEARRNVKFDLGTKVGTDPVVLDPEARIQLRQAASTLGYDPIEFATVGHDAAMFAKSGLRSAMVLVRNANGSHNEHEEMELADFGMGCQVLAHHLVQERQ